TKYPLLKYAKTTYSASFPLTVTTHRSKKTTVSTSTMESRLLLRATVTGVPQLRRPIGAIHRQVSTASSFTAFAKLIGSVGEGGNLISGRQLRPILLLDSSPEKREILKPVRAAAGDSAGEAKVGFLGKYPWLVTGFFFFMWYVYFLNVIFNILNKKIYNYFPYPYFVSAVHLFVGVVYCLLSWSVGLPKRAPIDSNLLKVLIPVAVCHAIGHITSNVSFAAVAVSFTHTIKALEPFFNASASQFLLGQSIPITLWLSLAPVVLGVAMASLTELSFNWLGFISAMISNISFTYRSIFSKKAMTDMDSTNVYAYISIIALIVCIPPAIIVEGPQLLKHGFSDAIAKVGMTKFISDLFWVGMFYHLYNQLATNTLERVAPLTHAVGNVLKRVFVIGFSIVIFGNKISTQTGIGTGIAIAGVALYSIIKAKIEEDKKEKMINVRYGFSFASERKDGVESGGQRLHKQFFRQTITELTDTNRNIPVPENHPSTTDGEEEQEPVFVRDTGHGYGLYGRRTSHTNNEEDNSNENNDNDNDQFYYRSDAFGNRNGRF
ncbi:unnamed protein product, partial [Brassica oleracea var. botrytis]